VAFEERNVRADREAAQDMIQRSGQNTVPVIYVGDSVLIGFNAQALVQKLVEHGLIAGPS